MYILPAFNEPDLNTLHDFVEQHSFGVLISQVAGEPFATHLPFLLERSSGSQGTLIGHTARANPQCLQAGDQRVLAIFSGPHAYISPTWYAADNVVPTWNYVAVHAYGRIRLVEDESSLLEIVRKTTAFYEKSMPQSWMFDDSTMFASRLLSQIVGFRIVIERIEGKWKLNQNHPVERQQKVVQALEGRPSENAQAVASMMKSRLEK